MPEFLESFVDWVENFSVPVLGLGLRIILLLISTAIIGGLLLGVIYGAWLALSGSLRREQRARSFIHLLELGLRQGQTIEQTIASLSRARVPDLGVYFHLLAAWMERGYRLGAALEKVPKFLPPQVAAMLRVADATGQLPKILPVCRASLRPGASDARKQTNNVMVLFFVSPIGPIVAWIIAIFVLPKFQQLAEDMEIGAGPALGAWFQASLIVGLVTSLLWLALWILETSRWGGAWITRGIFPGLRPISDWMSLWVPWRRKRILRDFSALFGTLLDAGITEEQALALAAEGTGNSVVQGNAVAAVEELAQGKPLSEAAAAIDRSGEFRWRLTNAARAHHGFSSALAGWNESLEARAFQQEQIYSQAVSTSFVLLNGAMVALASIGIFHFLTQAVESITW